MNDLGKLERVTIKFPIPIMAEEIDEHLINYLRNNIPCDILYGLLRGKKNGFYFKGNIRRPPNSCIRMPDLRFVINGNYHFGPELPIFFL